MALPIPRRLFIEPIYRPLLAVLENHNITTSELAAHWRYTGHHLENLRRVDKGPPFFHLPTGAVRYRTSDIVEAELAGAGGPLSLDAVSIAIASCTEVPEKFRVHIIEQLEKALRPGAKGSRK